MPCRFCGLFERRGGEKDGARMQVLLDVKLRLTGSNNPDGRTAILLRYHAKEGNVERRLVTNALEYSCIHLSGP